MSERSVDPVLERAVEELRALPAVSPGTVERVAASAIAVRRLAAEAGERPVRWRRWLSYTAVAAAACVVGYAARGVVRSGPPAGTTAAAAMLSPTAPGLELTSNSDAIVRPLAWQFVFHNARAHHVALIGDFNGWNPKATHLARAPGSSLWSVTVPLMPGRHSYAFMVDDTSFVLDPRAPVTHDPDLGSRESVVVVERP